MRVGWIPSVIVGVIVLAGSAAYRLQAEPSPLAPDKIGVVSIVQVLQQSQKNGAEMQGLQVLQAEHRAELEQLQQALETDQAALQTMLPGSEDHLQQLKLVFDKQATLKSRQEYYNQLLNQKQRAITEKYYRRALEATQAIAEAQGLSLVLEKSDPQFPVPGDLLFTVASHKVLYAKGCVDITAAVLQAVDQ